MPPREISSGVEKNGASTEKLSLELHIFNPVREKWSEVREEVQELLSLNVAPEGIPLEQNPEFTEEVLKRLFEDPKTIAVFLRDQRTLRIQGFTFAIPDEDDGSGKTAYIYSTKIRPQLHGQRLIVSLMAELEAALKKKGYDYLTRDARILNGYADKIQKSYKGRILESKDHDSAYGPQRYFKIAL